MKTEYDDDKNLMNLRNINLNPRSQINYVKRKNNTKIQQFEC